MNVNTAITDFLGNNAGRHGLLFKANFAKAGVVVPKVRSIVRLLVSARQGKVVIPADQFVLTLLPAHSLYSLYSVRANAVEKGQGKGPANPDLKFPIEGPFYLIDDGFIPIPAKEQFPDAQILADNRDRGKKNHFIAIHGFNVSLDDAKSEFNEDYRRLFWLGFRGNFVGLTWDGDMQIPKGEIPFVQFHVSYRHALHSSFPAMRFMETVTGWAGSPDNVNMMAHSLGNLVMWDATRIYGRYVDAGTRKAKGLVRNIISNESAVWQEAFEPETPLVYDSTFPKPPTPQQRDKGEYPAARRRFDITYPVNPGVNMTNAEKQHSWRFWFNPKNHNARIGLSKGYHSSPFKVDDMWSKS